MMSPTRLEAAQIFLSNGQLLTHKYCCIPFFEWIWRVWPNLGRSKGKWGQRNVGNYWELLLVFVEGINIGSSRVCHGSIEMMDVSSAGILVLLLPSCKSCKIVSLTLYCRVDLGKSQRKPPLVQFGLFLKEVRKTTQFLPCHTMPNFLSWLRKILNSFFASKRLLVI